MSKSLPEVNLNLNVRGLSQSATLEINERCSRLAQEGRQVFKLGLGQSPFPVPQPVVEALQKNAYQKDYLPVKGLAELRSAVAKYHCSSQGFSCSEDDVLIGPGSKELMFILQLVYYGDLVIPTPSWVSYAPQAHIIGRHIRWLPTVIEDGWRVTPEEIRTLCEPDPGRPRIIVLNYPNNPSGCTYSPDELKALAKMARRFKTILLSDEIYGELHHEGAHVSVSRYYPEGTIISSGLSKWCGAGGWRLGTFTFPNSLQWLLNAMAVVASETYTATSAPIQYAAVRAFKGGSEMERYLSHSRFILGALGRALARQLSEAAALVPKPEGAFYLFANFGHFKERLHSRGVFTSTELCHCLLEETGVAVLPGSVFGRPPGELTARLAYVDFDGTEALAAAEELSSEEPKVIEFLKTYCSRPLTAVNRLCEWLSEV
jgi:aspartate aminotransferase